MQSSGNYLGRIWTFCWHRWHWFPIAMVLLINLKLHTGPDLADPESVQEDLLAQMDYLEGRLHEGQLGRQMQGLFPEGHLFTHVLYGLTWCELAIHPGAEPDAVVKAKALAEARWALEQIDSKEGQSTFDQGMIPAYGMFYQGWRNYLLAKIVEASHGNNSAEVVRFGVLSREVQACFEKGKRLFPDSYPDQCWPADACVGMASLALYGRLVGPEFEGLRKTWVQQVGRMTEGGSKGLPHQVTPTSTEAMEGPRGCSAALNLYFLAEIDSNLAKQQFSQFRSQFGLSRLGLQTTAEYPDGAGGLGDVDSGPVIWGVGSSGTIVSIGSYLRLGDLPSAQSLSNTVEALGFSHGLFGKRYLLGALPIADLFIAWARVQALRPHLLGLPTPAEPLGSATRFHLVSLLLIGLILSLRYGRQVWQKFRG